MINPISMLTGTQYNVQGMIERALEIEETQSSEMNARMKHLDQQRSNHHTKAKRPIQAAYK